MPGYFRPVKPSDIPDVLPRLREEDVREWEAVCGVHPRYILPYCGNSPDTYAMVDRDGVIVGLFGVGPVEDNPLIGAVWLIATPELERSQIEFLRKCRAVIVELLDKYPILWNHVDARNALHIKWLKWCGFKFVRKKTYGAQSLPFYEIMRIKDSCA
jgi:hypothetical protein